MSERRLVEVTEVQQTPLVIRWAIPSGKIGRHELDGSLRFVFRQEHLEELRRLSGKKASLLK